MLKVFIFFFITSNSLLFTQNLDNQIQLNIIEDIKLFHSPPEPLFTGRPFELSLVTELSESIINLKGKSGLYKFKINTKDFPGNSIEYFFAVKTNDGKIYGAPVNDQNALKPIKKVFLDPVKYYDQKQRLNQ